jgi:uncharacterized membrane protein YcfT
MEEKVMNTHGLAFICLVPAYLLVNVLAAIKVGAFTMGRSPQRRVIDAVAFLFWGSLIIMGLWLMTVFRKFDEWAV